MSCREKEVLLCLNGKKNSFSLQFLNLYRQKRLKRPRKAAAIPCVSKRRFAFRQEDILNAKQLFN